MTQPAASLLSLDDVRGRIEQLAALIGAPASVLPTYGRTADAARPHIEIDSRYHWVVVERGEELERRSTASLDQLLYWVFESVIFSMACGYELAHRKPGQDFRRILFGHELELLRRLDPDWAREREAEQAATLARHPFTS